MIVHDMTESVYFGMKAKRVNKKESGLGVFRCGQDRV